MSATATIKSPFRNPRIGPRKLWGINELVYVQEPATEIRQNLLISEVEFNLLESQGFETRLTMRLPEVYSDQPANGMRVRHAEGEFKELASAFREGVAT